MVLSGLLIKAGQLKKIDFFNEIESFGILQGNFACLPYFVMHTFLNSFCVLTQVWCRKKVDSWY
jgi:hypothetical protein